MRLGSGPTGAGKIWPCLDRMGRRHRLSAWLRGQSGRLFGNSPDFRPNAQRAVDVLAAQAIGEQVGRTKPLRVA